MASYLIFRYPFHSLHKKGFLYQPLCDDGLYRFIDELIEIPSQTCAIILIDVCHPLKEVKGFFGELVAKSKNKNIFKISLPDAELYSETFEFSI